MVFIIYICEIIYSEFFKPPLSQLAFYLFLSETQWHISKYHSIKSHISLIIDLQYLMRTKLHSHKLLMSLSMLIKTEIEEVQCTFITKFDQKRIVALVVNELHFRNIKFIVFFLYIGYLVKHFFKVTLNNSGTTDLNVEVLH